MPVGYSNLSGYVQGRIDGAYPDIGQTYYMVDSNYRTAAQGWSRADRTGPLDLWGQRNPGYVYYTPEAGNPGVSYATTAAAIQAAVDAMIDFRGDALFFTPGNYDPATAVSINVPDIRLLGPRKSHPVNASSILTAGVASAFTITAAADRFEVGHLQIVPLTAAICFDLGAVSGGHFHDCFYNMDGIAASTSTIMVQVASAAEFLSFERSYVWADAAQGPWINCAGIMKGLNVNHFTLFIEAGTWAAAIDLEGVGAANFDIGPGIITGGGTALTSLLTAADKTSNTTHGLVHHITASTVGPAAASLAVATGAAAEIDIALCRRGVATDTATIAAVMHEVLYTG